MGIISGGDINTLTNRGLIDAPMPLWTLTSNPDPERGSVPGRSINAHQGRQCRAAVSSLGRRADLVDTRSGLQNGAASSGGGNDLFIGQAGHSETLSAGAGIDILDFRLGA